MIIDEVLEEARAEIARHWVSWETRFSAPAGDPITLDIKMAKPAPQADPAPQYSRSGRQFSEIAQTQLAKGRATTHKLRHPRQMEACSNIEGHWWVSNGSNKVGQKREKCRRCGRSRNATD
jgi:hypothetical protein